jgi:hypothetical protein
MALAVLELTNSKTLSSHLDSLKTDNKCKKLLTKLMKMAHRLSNSGNFSQSSREEVVL